ncbi:MAG: ORF6N domain-containing protein [Clostridiales bacterium]|jgi:phage regulator Rha-like protein|nr:ORF6N domain-containing protein [Clostridiales bacterium]
MELETIKSKIITVQGQQVILDSDVAELYGVETKRINEAVKNNPDKFPDGYIITLTDDEMRSLRSKFSTLENAGRGKYAKYNAKGLTERGLYMLATILKSPVATETTLAIIETFAKVRELSRTVAEIGQQTDKEVQKNMLRRSGEIIADIITPTLEITDTETSVELNLAVLSVKHTVKRSSKKES